MIAAPMDAPAFPDLRAYLDQLRRDGDLVTVSVPVDPRLEAAEIHRRVIAAGGPALLFTNVTGTGFPLVTNLFGTRRRVEKAFGRRPLEFVRRLAELAQRATPPDLRTVWQERDFVRQLLRVGTSRQRSGPVAEVVTRDVRLEQLPVITSWPEDGGPFVTLPLVYTEHPERKGHNLGIYRMQVYGPRTTGMHWQIGKGGGFHHAVAEARGEALPVTVFLGGHPRSCSRPSRPCPRTCPS